MDLQELRLTADLAHIALQEEEFSRLILEVEQMMVAFAKMSEVDVTGLEPTTHAFIKKTRTRPDSCRESVLADEMLEQAPDLEDRFICIPNVL